MTRVNYAPHYYHTIGDLPRTWTAPAEWPTKLYAEAKAHALYVRRWGRPGIAWRYFVEPSPNDVTARRRRLT